MHYYLSIFQERIVPPDPITPGERRATLNRLNQVIQHRLVTGNLQPQMRNLKVGIGWSQNLNTSKTQFTCLIVTVNILDMGSIIKLELEGRGL